MAELRGSFSFIRDPQGEAERLAFERQVSAGQVCAAQDRSCDADCEIGPAHCPNHHQARKTHDPDHCDRAWAAREASDAPG